MVHFLVSEVPLYSKPPPSKVVGFFGNNRHPCTWTLISVALFPKLQKNISTYAEATTHAEATTYAEASWARKASGASIAVVPYTQSCPHARSVRTTSACAPRTVAFQHPIARNVSFYLRSLVYLLSYTQSCPHACNVRATSACASPNRCVSAPPRGKRFVLTPHIREPFRFSTTQSCPHARSVRVTSACAQGYRGYSKLRTHTAVGPCGRSMLRSIGPS